MIKYENGRPVLSYNFDATCPAAKGSHMLRGKGRQHRVPTDLVTGTIRSLTLPVQHCASAKSK